jgi:hypothetical protein
MVIRLFIITLFYLVNLNFAQAQVWQHDSKKQWTEKNQIKYSNWVSSKLGTDFFKSLGSPYTGLRLDCADAHYALLAFFSRQEGLPFAINKGNLTNMTTQFNSITDLDKRFVAFVKYIAGSYGTEALAANDSYPIAFNALRPGDLFMYKIGSNGNYTRHTYILKNINPDGTFDVVYSTQAAAAAGRPLIRKASYMFNHAPTNTGGDRYNWGFKRAKPAEYAGVSSDKIPNADFMQYALADKYRKEPATFFRLVKKSNQTMQESPQRLISRHLDGLCGNLNDRVGIVQEAQKFLAKTGEQCMAFQDFDAYSTPSRDSGLADDFLNMAYDYNSLAQNGTTNKIGNNVLTVVVAALNQRRSSSEDNALTNFCKVEFAKGPSGFTNIGNFFDALFDLKVSYHPNDNIYRRWGFSEGRATGCKEFYGYARPIVRNIR